MPRIPKIVSKLALVLLLNTYKRFQIVIEEYSTVFGTCLLYSRNRIKTCTSVVIEYLHPVPISTQTIFYNFRNKTLCPFHIRSPNFHTQKEEPH